MPTPDELADRQKFFAEALSRFSSEINKRASPDGVVERSETINCAVELYFHLSDLYKQKRVHRADSHRTEVYKVAAITTATLACVCLLEPRHPGAVSSDLVGMCNEYFSVYCACAILKVKDWQISQNELRRHYLALRSLELDACNDYIAALNNPEGSDVDLSRVRLSNRDLSALDQLVNIYSSWWRGD